MFSHNLIQNYKLKFLDEFFAIAHPKLISASFFLSHFSLQMKPTKEELWKYFIYSLIKPKYTKRTKKLPLRQNIKVVGYFIRPHLVFGNILNLIRDF